MKKIKQLEQEDIQILEKMTEKYEVSFRDLLEMVSSQIKSVNIQVRLTDKEKAVIDKKAKKCKMKRSAYISKRLEEFVNTDDSVIFEKYNLLDADIHTRKDRKVVAITLPPFLLEKTKEKAKRLNINLSILVRYLGCEMD